MSLLSRDKNGRGCEADHSPPSNAKVENAWSYNSTSSTRLNVLHRNNSVFQLKFY